MSNPFGEYWKEHGWTIVFQAALIIVFIIGQAFLIEYRLKAVEQTLESHKILIETNELRLSSHMLDSKGYQTRVITLLESLNRDIERVELWLLEDRRNPPQQRN